MVDNLKVGCRGLILAPDLIDHAVKVYDAYRTGDEVALLRCAVANGGKLA